MSVQTEELQVHFSETGASSLESAYQRIGTANDRLSQSVTRTTGSFSNYLKSDKKITGNLREITSLAISGANAQDLLAASIYRVGASFKGALVVGATLAVGHTIYQGLKKASDEADALEKSIERVLQPSGPTEMKSVAQISSQLEEVRKNRETLEKQLKSPVKTAMITDPLANARKNPIRTAVALATGGLGGGFLSAARDTGAADHREKRINELRDKEASLLSELAKKEQEIADIASTRMHVSEREADLAAIRAKYAEKIGEAESAGPGQNPEKAKALHKLQELEIEAANRKNDALDEQLDLEIAIARVRQPGALGGQVLTMDQQRLDVLQKQADEAERQLKASKGLSAEARQRATLVNENAQNDLTGEQLKQHRQNRGPEGIKHRRQQRTDARERSALMANRDVVSPHAYKRHPDAYNAQNQPHDPNGRQHQSQLGNRRSSIQSGSNTSQLGKQRTPDAEWNARFTPSDKEANARSWERAGMLGRGRDAVDAQKALQRDRKDTAGAPNVDRYRPLQQGAVDQKKEKEKKAPSRPGGKGGGDSKLEKIMQDILSTVKKAWE